MRTGKSDELTHDDSRPSVAGVDGSTLAKIAVEVWRLGRRLDRVEHLPAGVRQAHERLRRLLDDGGVEIRDPYGERFFEGSNAEVIDGPGAGTVEPERLLVTDVLRPGVFINGTCVIAPQVVLGSDLDRPSED